MKAFPNQGKTKYGVGGIKYQEITDEGMDLRDYFAAKAMQAIMTNSSIYFPKIAGLSEKHNEDADLVMAKLSYVYADAMMKARESK